MKSEIVNEEEKKSLERNRKINLKKKKWSWSRLWIKPKSLFALCFQIWKKKIELIQLSWMKCDQNTRLDTQWMSATMAQVQTVLSMDMCACERMQTALSN